MAGAFLDGLGCQGGRLGTGGAGSPFPWALDRQAAPWAPPGASVCFPHPRIFQDLNFPGLG